MGRATAANGNGHAEFPSDLASPVTRYRQPDGGHHGLRTVGRVFFWLFALVAMLASAFAGGLYLFFHESLAATRPQTRSEKAAVAKLDVPLPHAPAIALVIGYDKRYGESGPGRSDTLMLIRADPQAKAISMMSFPRDLSVQVRCPSGWFTGKINSAYATCKEEGALETVKALTGLQINYLITVNFHGFKQVVDKLGGVWIDVDRRYYHSNAGVGLGYQYAKINLQPGYQLLRGSDALDFVRYRHADSDLYRNARQQLFVRAVKDQLSSASITKLFGVVSAITSNVHAGEGGNGGRAIPARTILRFAKLAYGLPPGHVFQARIQGLTGQYDLFASQSSIQQAVQDFVNPDLEAGDKAAAAAGVHRKHRSKKGPRPQQVTVVVVNGNGVDASALNASTELHQRGYATEFPANGAEANAPRKDYYKTIVYYNPAQAQAQAAAQQLATLFGAAEARRGFPRRLAPMAGEAMALVVVGTTYHGSIAPIPLDRTPRHEPATVTRNPRATLSALRPLRRRVPFKLELPAVLESNSALVGPARVYSITQGHRAVRLAFKKPASCESIGIACEYWGIEETDWSGAPVLAGRSFEHVLGGRTFDFYFSSSHLHMIVLRQGAATYWVVNTLLDSLSNETMIAIARGLRPLAR